jgi:hypothetical protein
VASIAEFLEARLAEDEALAVAASVSLHGERHTKKWDYASYVLSSERDATEAQDKFIAEWWPARVLAECAAKRDLIKLAAQAGTLDDLQANQDIGFDDIEQSMLEALAAVYADHPDYRQEWAIG